MTSPTPLNGAGEKGHIEARNQGTRSNTILHLFPIMAFHHLLVPEHTEGQPGCHSGLLPPPYEGNGGHWSQRGSLHGFQGPLATDEALPWTWHYIKPLLCLNPSRKLWEFTLSIC